MNGLKIHIVLLLCLPFWSAAQEKRAVIIGIDRYTPTGGYSASTPYWVSAIHDLAGCRNDALTMRSLLLSRFGFSAGNIDSVFDGQATRAAILGSIRALLA